MTKSKFYLITLLTAILLSVVLGSSSVFASDISSTNQAEPTISVPVSQWNELKSNNAKALSLIEASSVPLTEAQTIAVKQRQELNEAHNTINKLENELMQAKLQSMKQEIVLSEMQNSLTELKGQIDNDKRTIKRLRMQRNLSQILGAGATIGVVIHR
jgi:membrane-associated HD superfamily phosphohydrolase